MEYRRARLDTPLHDSAAVRLAGESTKPAREIATLTLLLGCDRGGLYELECGELVLGRGEGCQARIDDPHLSRRHARIVRVGHEFWVHDLGSTNGTFVNGESVDHRRLVEGDRVGLGPNVLFAFRLQDRFEQEATRRILDEAMRDPLTRAWNRRYFMAALESARGFARRNGDPIALLMIDADHFKSINDRHGHIVGDAMLCAIVTAISSVVRTEDLVARYGGEEFCVLARGLGHRDAVSLAERIREAVENCGVTSRGTYVHTTVSIGFATMPGDVPLDDARGLLVAADAALYRAKARGRNRVEHAAGHPPE